MSRHLISLAEISTEHHFWSFFKRYFVHDLLLIVHYFNGSLGCHNSAASRFRPSIGWFRLAMTQDLGTSRGQLKHRSKALKLENSSMAFSFPRNLSLNTFNCQTKSSSPEIEIELDLNIGFYFSIKKFKE